MIVKVASGSAGADYGKEQNITGVVLVLVKDGVGSVQKKTTPIQEGSN